MLRQRHTGGLRLTRCSSGPQGASWPGLACWIKDTDGAEVERMVKQGTKGFEDFWARYKEQHKDEPFPQVGSQEAPEAPDYFNPAANGKDLLKDVVKYGEMVQSVYDTLETKDINSHFFGKMLPHVMEPGQPLSKYDDMGIITLRSEEGKQYKVMRIIKADSGAYKLIKINQEHNYVGFIAEGPPDPKGGVDIAVVFRGTITTDEWLQDIKALQVCWNRGRPVFAAPRSQLDASRVPFDFSWQWFIGPLVLLQLVQLGLQLGLGHKLAGALTWLLGMQLQDADLQLTSFCVPAAGLTWLVQGVLAGHTKYPNTTEWLVDLGHWFLTILQWAVWGSINPCRTVLDCEDAHISFGFKEMYADAHVKPTAPVTPCPRLTVMTTLAELLEKYQSPVDGQKLHIKSITVTGHSLGGALASLCAWDIGTTFNDACTEPTGLNWWQRPLQAINSKLQELTAVKKVKECAEAVGLVREPLYDRTDQQRGRLMEAVRQLQMSNAVLPAVAAVTFAAPMVGNAMYARNFKITGCKDQPVKPGMLRVVDAPDVVPMLPLTLPPTLPLKLPLMLALTLAPALLFTWALTLPLTLPLTLALTPALPLPPTLAFWLALAALALLCSPQLFSYQHGGQELQVDYDDVPYFTDFDTLPGVRARHNHEMYMHLLDPTRDIALANKTERVLVSGQNVPGCWWSPVPNHRMIETKRGKWQQVGSTRKALEWYAARAPHDNDEASRGNGHTDSKDNTTVHEASARMVNVP